jgi:hypothetical protein
VTIFEVRAIYPGNGHPVQMFTYVPTLGAALRIGVERYPDVEVPLGPQVPEGVPGPDDPAGVKLTVVVTGCPRVEAAPAPPSRVAGLGMSSIGPSPRS